MRLTEEQVLSGILHPNVFARELAVRYFAESGCRSPAPMHAVIEGVRAFGWDGFLGMSLRSVTELPQDDETVCWCIEELQKAAAEGHRPKMRLGLRDFVHQFLATADPELLRRHEAAIFGLEGIPETTRESIVQRIRLLDLDVGTCWDELEALCEREKDKQYASEIDQRTGRALVDVLARYGADVECRMVGLLEDLTADDDFVGSPVTWLEGFVALLAGRMRCAAAVPALVRKLAREGGWLQEQCLTALPQIGSDAVVSEIAREFAAGDWSFRLYASGVLGRIHSDLSDRTLRELLEAEPDPSIRDWLADSAVVQLSDESFQAVHAQAELQESCEWGSLCEALVGAAFLLNQSCDELERWHEEAHRERQEFERHSSAPSPNVGLDVLGKAFDALDLEYPFARPPRPADDDHGPPSPATVRDVSRIGRNDPCPCGSGKKYKKCCWQKQQASHGG